MDRPRDLVDRCRVWPVIATLFVSLGLMVGCGTPPYRAVHVTPSLAPVDTSRPMVRYKAIQGQACGAGGLLKALWDMKRLPGADGYVEVVIEEASSGDSVCTTVTSHPFTYGETPRSLAELTGAPEPAPAATDSFGGGDSYGGGGATSTGSDGGGGGAPAASGPDHETCKTECTRFGKLAGTTDLIRKVVTDRCVQRCDTHDPTYFACITDAKGVRDVKACNAK